MTESTVRGETSAAQRPHPGLAHLAETPFLAALSQRRTRRVAQGVSLRSKGLSHESRNAPSPLTPLEEAVLIVSTGLTGAVMHDGPLEQVRPASPSSATPFLHVTGRTGSSADNAQATSFFMINDEGIWLLKRLWGREAMEIFKEMPPHWEDCTEDDWLAVRRRGEAQGLRQRLEFPRTWPYYLGWNAQHSNRPGTTCFLPVVDSTRQYINVLLILLSRAEGQAAAVHRRLAPVPAAERARLGRVGSARRSASSTRSRTSRSAASSACAAADHDADNSGAARLRPHGAHRLRGVLPDAEPDADGRGAAASAAGSTARR